MKTWKTSIAIGLIVVVALCVGYYSYISPSVTLEEIRSAAQNNDKDRLRDLIDFDSLKSGLKEDIKSQLAASSGDLLRDGVFAALGILMVGAVVDPLVEGIVSPAGITNIIGKGLVEATTKRNGNTSADESTVTPKAQDGVNIEQGYDGLSRYRIRIRRSGEKPEQLLTITLRREGLFSWRLTGVSIPQTWFASMNNVPGRSDPPRREGLSDPFRSDPRRRADLMALKSSELNVVPGRENVIELRIVMENQAPNVQEFPALELTLSDAHDAAVARRVLLPTDYLSKADAARVTSGILGKEELSLKVLVEMLDIRPHGYQLFLYYPNQDKRPVERQLRPESVRILPE